MNSIKRNIISGFLTILVISLLILSGPARAIDVSVATQDIDVLSESAEYTFTISVTINEGEFLPIQYTHLIFDDGENKITCKIKDEKADCNFINSVKMSVNSLDYEQDYGYGYGYGNGYGWQDFGYGYGYGSGTRGQTGPSWGIITYTLGIDQSKLPGTFIDEDVDVEARVYGGTDSNQANFRGSSSFHVNATEQIIPLVSTVENTLNFKSSKIKIPTNALPAGATGIKVKQIAKKTVAAPKTATLKVLSKVFEFKIDGGTTNIFNEPVTLTITYTDEELALVGITDETKISPYFFDETANDWTNAGITDIVRDTVNNEIEFKVLHFTKFSLLADTSTPTDDTTTTTTTSTGGGGGGTRTGIIPAAKAVEEVPTEAITPTPEETTTGGLGAVTGAVVGAVKNNSGIIVIIVGVVILIGLVWRITTKNPFGKGKGRDYQPYARYH